jgi:GABA(A) receptor-associated protein
MYTFFQDEKNFAQRQALSSVLLEQYPHCVPIIVERSPSEKNLKNIDKRKYLAPNTMTVGNFCFTIHRQLKLASHESLWIYAGNFSLTATSTLMRNIYDKYQDPDGFLYLKYKGEDIYG